MLTSTAYRHRDRPSSDKRSSTLTGRRVWADLEQLPQRSPSTAPEPRRPIPTDFDAFAAPSDVSRNSEDPLADLAKHSISLDSFERIRREAPGVPLVILSGLEDQAIAMEAVRRGAQVQLFICQWRDGRDEQVLIGFPALVIESDIGGCFRH